jgi:hypothetical protein
MTHRLFPHRDFGPNVRLMETRPSPAEDLPALYRAILDGIAQLERVGARREAGLLRTEATQIYSTAWNDAGLRRLGQIQRRIERVIAGDERPRTAYSRTRYLAERARVQYRPRT